MKRLDTFGTCPALPVGRGTRIICTVHKQTIEHGTVYRTFPFGEINVILLYSTVDK